MINNFLIFMLMLMLMLAMLKPQSGKFPTERTRLA